MPDGDPSLYYGNQYPEELASYGNMAQGTGGAPMYGDSQAGLSGMRAAYGDIPAYMVSGAGMAGGGAYMGVRNMFSDIGGMVRPMTYTPPARVNVGYYGETAQRTGFLRGMTGVMGLNETPRGVYSYDYGQRNAADFGERIGGGIAAGATTAAGLAIGSTVGSVAMRGVGGFLGSALGPAGGAAGAFLGGAFGGFALGAAGANYLNETLAQRREVNNYLESTSFRYVGAGSSMADARTGGMNVRSRQQTMDMIRKIDINDPTLDTGDLTRVLEQGTQMGMFAGVSDMETFKKKFKDLTDGVKVVTKTFQTTLEEGMKIIKDFKGIGVDASRVPELSRMTDAIGRTTGRTAQEVMGLGMQGAEIFRGTGVEMSIGYQANVMNLASVRAARDAKLLSQEAISQAGGEEALATRMTVSGLQFAQSALGRGFSAAAFGPKGLDQNAFREMTMGGKFDYNALALQSVQNLGSPDKVIAFQANQAKFLSEAGQKFGGQGLQMMQNTEAMARASFLVESGATKNMKDALRFAFQETGMSDAEIDTRVASMENAKGEFSAKQAGVQATRLRTMSDEARSNFLLFRAVDRVSDAVKGVADTVVAPISRDIDTFKTGVVNFWEKQAEGITRADLRGLDYNDFAGTADLDPNAPKAKEAAIDLDVGGALGKSAGEKLLGSIKAGETAAFGLTSRLLKGDQAAKSTDVILETEFGGLRSVVDRKELDRAVRESAASRMSVAEAQKMKDEGKLKGIEPGLISAIRRGLVTADSTVQDVAKLTFGKTLENLSQEERGALLLEAQSSDEMKALFDKNRSGAIALEGVGNAITVQEHAQSLGEIEKARESTYERLLVKFSPEVFNKLALARAKRSSDPKEADRLLDEATRLQLVDSQRQTKEAEADGGIVFGSTENVTRAISRFMAEDSFAVEAGVVQRSAGKIAKGQRRLAFERMEGSLDLDLRSTTLSKEDQVKTRDVIERLKTGTNQDLVSMSDADAKLLKATDTGRGILQQRDIVTRIAELKGDKDLAAATDPVKRKELFKKGMEGLGLADEQLGKLADTFVSRGAGAAVDQSVGEFTKPIAGEVLTAGPSGGLAETAKGTGEEAMILQTNINMQILTALQALSTKLK